MINDFNIQLSAIDKLSPRQKVNRETSESNGISRSNEPNVYLESILPRHCRETDSSQYLIRVSLEKTTYWGTKQITNMGLLK